MNPYAAPAVSPSEDRTDPRFQVIQPASLPFRLIITLPLVAALVFGTAICIGWIHPRRFLPPYFVAVFGTVPSLAVMWWRSFRLPAKLRTHPLVLGGHALYAGQAALGHGHGRRALRGYLFITAEALVFFSRSGGWDSGELTTIRLAEIVRVECSRWFRLTLHRRSGTEALFTMQRVKVWEKAIDQIRFRFV